MTATQKMTKGTSKAQRRAKAKTRRTINLAGGEVSTAPAGQGQGQAQEEARKTALAARVRVYGIKRTIARKAEEEAADPMCGSGVGMCIRSIAPSVARDVWQTWQSICAAQLNYRARILGMTGSPQGSAIAMLTEAMAADVSHTIDIRGPEERDIAARRAWKAWQASINSLPLPQYKWAMRSALSGGMDGMGADTWRDGAPTQYGRNLVAALIALTDTKA